MLCSGEMSDWKTWYVLTCSVHDDLSGIWEHRESVARNANPNNFEAMVQRLEYLSDDGSEDFSNATGVKYGRYQTGVKAPRGVKRRSACRS